MITNVPKLDQKIYLIKYVFQQVTFSDSYYQLCGNSILIQISLKFVPFGPVYMSCKLLLSSCLMVSIYKLIVTCRLCVIYVKEDNDSVFSCLPLLQWPVTYLMMLSPIGQWAFSQGRPTCLSRSVHEVQTNYWTYEILDMIKSQNSMTCILSFILQIQLKILHDIVKSVFLIATKFQSDTTSHCSVVTELK